MADAAMPMPKKASRICSPPDILSPMNRPPVLTLLGDALDAQKKYAEAFPCYVQANDELRRLHAAEQATTPRPKLRAT